MFATAGKYVLILVLLFGIPACKVKKPIDPRKPQAAVIIRQKHPVLTPEQRAELGFPGDLISKIEISAGSEAEPFFVTVLMSSQNLKGDKEFEADKLAGFSVRTKYADDIIDAYRAGLRVRGYIIFKSQKGYGNLPDIVSVVKGNNSYDILRIQGTEASSYQLGTKAIIVWLKEQQKLASFVITGAGSDWLEARFIQQPHDMPCFAKKISAFAPDVHLYGAETVNEMAERMKKMNGFYLVWD